MAATNTYQVTVTVIATGAQFPFYVIGTSTSNASSVFTTANTAFADSSLYTITTTLFAAGIAIGAAPISYYTNSAVKVIGNTNAETTVFGSALTAFAADFLTLNRHIRIELSGTYSAAVVPGTLTGKVKLGSTTIVSVAINTLVSTAVNLAWDAVIDIATSAVGASGSVLIFGSISFASNSTGTARADSDPNNGTTPQTIDTTVTQVLDVTVQWNTANASNILNVGSQKVLIIN